MLQALQLSQLSCNNVAEPKPEPSVHQTMTRPRSPSPHKKSFHQNQNFTNYQHSKPGYSQQSNNHMSRSPEMRRNNNHRANPAYTSPHSPNRPQFPKDDKQSFQYGPPSSQFRRNSQERRSRSRERPHSQHRPTSNDRYQSRSPGRQQQRNSTGWTLLSNV